MAESEKVIQSPEEIQAAFGKISRKIQHLSYGKLQKLRSLQRIGLVKRKNNLLWYFSVYVLVVASVFGLFFYNELHTSEGMSKFLLYLDSGDPTADPEELDGTECLVEMPESVTDMFRPPTDCGMCRDLKQVSKVSGITPTFFEEQHAYSGKPVVIVDGTKNWTAPEVFNFNFFKRLYPEDSPVMGDQCQFFPYRTSFESLNEVFNMTEDRANLKDGSKPWYIGWSNCDQEATDTLRKHYKRPYFLPTESESSKTDWIFMGSPGYGAHMHIDHVGNPSWQAQIKGRKKWTLEPPPECFLECRTVEVTVNPGEIIVLDTNRWFHKTLVLGDGISITIGSEYD